MKRDIKISYNNLKFRKINIEQAIEYIKNNFKELKEYYKKDEEEFLKDIPTITTLVTSFNIYIYSNSFGSTRYYVFKLSRFFPFMTLVEQYYKCMADGNFLVCDFEKKDDIFCDAKQSDYNFIKWCKDEKYKKHYQGDQRDGCEAYEELFGSESKILLRNMMRDKNGD